MFRLAPLAFALLLSSPLLADSLPDLSTRVVISVHDQKLALLENGKRVAVYPVSTSRYGLGDGWGSMATPLGMLQVAEKIGDRAPVGAVFHNRRWTGEVLRPNTPGRDPVMTRIIRLRGLEAANAHAFRRCIYIHGTNEENILGRPASYGCIRMRSTDIAVLYNQLPVGTLVQIVNDGLPGKSNHRPVRAPNSLGREPNDSTEDAAAGPRA
jgi:lipoprotein-anchoring transpeptidase ErfK/SrfK